MLPFALTARKVLANPVTARLVVVALVNVVFPRMVVAPVLDPMVDRPARVDRLGRDVVAANLVSNLPLVQNRLFVPSVRASVVVP
jgi:hypothetical protein